MYYMNIDGKNGDSGVFAEHGANIHVSSVDIINCTYAVKSSRDSEVVVRTSQGNADYAGRAEYGGTIKATGSIPKGATSRYSNGNGFIIENGTPTETDSSFSPPPITNEQFTQVFTPTSIYTVNHDTSSVDSYYPNQAAQGRWSGMSYAKDGCFKFSADAYNFMQGVVSIDSVKMRVKRRSTSHGYSSGVTPKPYGFSGSFNAISLGQWSNWVTVPSSLFTSAGPVLKFYGPVLNTDYAIFDACEVEIKVTKAV